MPFKVVTNNNLTLLKIQVSWVVMLHHWMSNSWRFNGSQHLHHEGSRLRCYNPLKWEREREREGGGGGGLLVQRQSITSQVTWVTCLSSSGLCQDLHFSQLQFPFHSLSTGMVALLRHNNTATTQAQLAGSATTADGSCSHSMQQIQNTVYKKTTSWCSLHRFQVLMNYDVHHSHNHRFILCKTYCFSVDCTYTQPVR